VLLHPHHSQSLSITSINHGNGPFQPRTLHSSSECERHYAKALAEIKRGKKRSHWMWFIFPMFTGLATSTTSKFFAIQSTDEARAYLKHPVLGPRLLENLASCVGIQHCNSLGSHGTPGQCQVTIMYDIVQSCLLQIGISGGH
jgi:hypothetical protein